jgi:hypothetical protein
MAVYVDVVLWKESWVRSDIQDVITNPPVTQEHSRLGDGITTSTLHTKALLLSYCLSPG